MPDRKNILIVDDSPESLFLLGRILSNNGFSTERASNGEQALNLIDKIKPDLILSDICMPIMDGYELCRQIKAREDLKHIPIIIISAKSNTSEDWTKALTAGASDFINKPFQIHELLARIEIYIKLSNTNVLLEETADKLRQANEKLLNAAQEWRKTFDSITDFLFVLDDNYNIKRTNKAFADLFKMGPKDIIGKKSHELFHQEFQSLYESAFKEVKKSKIPMTVELEEKNLNLFLLLTISPVFDGNGTNTATVNYLKDITERKKIEAELVRHRNHLEKLVKERTAELEISRDRAQNANRAKSEFLATMSHELRTPLNSIIGFSEVLHDELYGPVNSKQKEYLSDILNSGRCLLTLINDILDLSKVEAGKMELRFSTVNVISLLQNCTFIIKEKCLKQKLKLRIEAANSLEEFEADEQKLRQSLFNLLSNAVKFTPEGGEITIGAYAKDENIVIFVRDTGIGIEEKDKDKIFSTFQQLDSSLSRKYEGTGLGLALTKKFIELHGGTIWFESKGKNSGCTFFISIPLVRENPANKEQGAPLELNRRIDDGQNTNS